MNGTLCQGLPDCAALKTCVDNAISDGFFPPFTADVQEETAEGAPMSLVIYFTILYFLFYSVGVSSTIIPYDALGMEMTERGQIKTDAHWQTSVPGVYAIGDVIAGPMLAHKAEKEGVAVAEIIAGRKVKVDYNTVPGIASASTTTLTNTEAFLAGLDTIAGGVLDGKIIRDEIAWIGHSRGGEGIVRAYDRLVDNQFTSVEYDDSDIVLLSSIAPTVFLGPTTSDPHDVDFHLWTGAGDSDVNGC